MRWGNGGAESMTWGDWKKASVEFSAAIATSRARDCSAVAILAGNTKVWPVADLGTLLFAKTSVGIYPTSAPVQVEKMLADCAAGVLVVDSGKQLAAALEMQPRLPHLRVVVAACETDAPQVVTWTEWLAIGEAALARDETLGERIDRTARAIQGEAPAIIIYTSGSTGEPKGAVLSHECIEASTASIEETLGFRESDTTLSFLPFSHAAERITGLYTRIRCGIEVMMVEDPSYLWNVAHAYRPTIFGGLPRYYEKLFSLADRDSRSPDEVLGGRVRLATSGGAALPLHVAEGLHKSGITVLGAYGLTEHLCAAFNRPDSPTFDTAGPPMPGTEIRIATDGEVLIRRSALTFSGYHNMAEVTRAAFTDDGEWLRTGDLGLLDAAGRLCITGRKKELLALSNGKMVAPLPIEASLATHPLIAHAVLHAEGRQFVSALIALRSDTLATWAEAHGLSGSHDDLAQHPAVMKEIQKAIDEVNQSLSRAESIRRFVTIGRELTIAASEITPTHKVRRNAVLEKYSARLDALYSS
jgi:long-chain acyl-CoA synthetase